MLYTVRIVLETAYRFRYSFICQGTSTGHSYVEAIPLSALPKDTTSELAGLSPHYLF